MPRTSGTGPIARLRARLRATSLRLAGRNKRNYEQITRTSSTANQRVVRALAVGMGTTDGVGILPFRRTLDLLAGDTGPGGRYRKTLIFSRARRQRLAFRDHTIILTDNNLKRLFGHTDTPGIYINSKIVVT